MVEGVEIGVDWSAAIGVDRGRSRQRAEPRLEQGLLVYRDPA